MSSDKTLIRLPIGDRVSSAKLILFWSDLLYLGVSAVPTVWLSVCVVIG